MVEDVTDDGELAWAVIELAWDRLDLSRRPEQVLAQLDGFPEPIADLVCLVWCQKEIRNGGFVQLFRNSTGVLALRGIRGFERIGGQRYADLVRQAILALGDPHPISRKERANALKMLPAADRRELFDRLEREFYGLLRDPDHELEGLRGGYVRSHLAVFTRP